jgi:hypothetical protein
MEAQVPSQKPDFARIVMGCKGLTYGSVMSKYDHNVNQAVHRLCLNQTVNRYYLLHVIAITMICMSSDH